jgi:hypothetical protein
MAQHALPSLGSLPIQEIGTADILSMLAPIWTEMPETASKVRARTEAVLAWATVAGRRSGTNPAAWRNHLDKLLPAPTKVRRVEHHPAMPYSSIPEFMTRLHKRESIDARALDCRSDGS